MKENMHCGQQEPLQGFYVQLSCKVEPYRSQLCKYANSKYEITIVGRHFYSDIRVVFQVVPAAVLQLHCRPTVYGNQACKWRETAVDGVDVVYMMN